MHRNAPFLAATAALAFAPLATAQESASAEPAADLRREAVADDMKYVLAGGYAHFFSADFDEGGGDAEVDRAFGSLRISGEPSETYSWDLGMQWEGSWYGFADAGDLVAAAGGKPWDAVQSVSISPGASFVLSERWRATARAFVQFSGENDADAFDSMTFGGAAGAMYAFSPKFLLGGGVLVSSQLEDDPLVIPQLLVDWRPCAEFRLSNFAGPEAFPGGAGLEGIWTICEEFEVALGSRYTYRRFRLDDSGDPARSEGVGTDEGLPVWLRATMRAKCGARLDLVAGVQVMGEMSLDDRDGDRLEKSDVEGAPFLGVFFSWKY